MCCLRRPSADQHRTEQVGEVCVVCGRRLLCEQTWLRLTQLVDTQGELGSAEAAPLSNNNKRPSPATTLPPPTTTTTTTTTHLKWTVCNNTPLCSPPSLPPPPTSPTSCPVPLLHGSGPSQRRGVASEVVRAGPGFKTSWSPSSWSRSLPSRHRFLLGCGWLRAGRTPSVSPSLSLSLSLSPLPRLLVALFS